MKTSTAGVSVRMPRSVTSDGTRPFGLIARYSGLFCWLLLKSIRSVVYGAPASCSAICEASAQLPGE
jgi:hypothetical protein